MNCLNWRSFDPAWRRRRGLTTIGDVGTGSEGNCGRPAQHARSRKGIVLAGRPWPQGWLGLHWRARREQTPDRREIGHHHSVQKFIAEVLKPRFLPKTRPQSSIIRSPSTGSGTATNIASSPATAPTTPIRMSRNARHRSHALNAFSEILSTCPTAGIRANGPASFNASCSRKPWRCLKPRRIFSRVDRAAGLSQPAPRLVAIPKILHAAQGQAVGPVR